MKDTCQLLSTILTCKFLYKKSCIYLFHLLRKSFSCRWQGTALYLFLCTKQHKVCSDIVVCNLQRPPSNKVCICMHSLQIDCLCKINLSRVTRLSTAPHLWCSHAGVIGFSAADSISNWNKFVSENRLHSHTFDVGDAPPGGKVHISPEERVNSLFTGAFGDDGGRSARQTFVIERRKKPQVGLIHRRHRQSISTPSARLRQTWLSPPTTITNFHHRLAAAAAFCAVRINGTMSLWPFFSRANMHKERGCTLLPWQL